MKGNPTGHFEHKGFLEINEALLARLGGGWDPPVGETRSRPRIFTFYSDHFGNRSEEIARLARFCGLGPNSFSTSSELLTTKFRHHFCGALQLFLDPEIPFPAKFLYYRLRAARLLLADR